MYAGFKDMLEYLQVEAFLVPEVMRKQRKGSACAFCYSPHACAIESVVGKARQGGLEQSSTSVLECRFHCVTQHINVWIITVWPNGPISPAGGASESIWGRF